MPATEPDRATPVTPALRVGFDVRSAVRARTGVGRYLHGLLPALAAQGVDVIAFSSSWRDRVRPGDFPGARVVDRRLPVRLLDRLWERHAWPPFAWLAGAHDISHSPTPLPLPGRGAARVVTVHDLFFLRAPEEALGSHAHSWLTRLDRALRAADAIVCVSEATARDVVTTLGLPRDRLDVVRHGLDERWLTPPAREPARETVRRLGVSGRYLLAVGALEVRKNYPTLLAALARARAAPGASDLQLVLAGPDGRDGERVRREVAKHGLEACVRATGYVSEPELQALYVCAEALCMPSLDEGFGFPVLEAMASGCPVVAARAGALPEIGGDAALYADPTDDQALAARLAAVLAGGELRASLCTRGRTRAAGFRWESAARATLEVYRRAREARAAAAPAEVQTCT